MTQPSVLDIREPGTYGLVLECRCAGRVSVGRLGTLPLEPGWYVYVGSALGPGGLAGRVGRHLRPGTTLRWHIDTLRARIPVREVWWAAGLDRREHVWAAELSEGGEGAVPLAGFGSSDCRCPAHLIRFRRRPGPRAINATVEAVS